jgi:hypothetical protein
MLTPAPSTVSVAEARAAGRTRGAGQVAAARPRTRAAPRRAVKRVKLEDDEDEEEEDDAEVVKPIARRTRGASAAVDAKMKVKTEVEADEEAEEEDNAPTLAPAPSAPVPANADPYYEDEYANADETDNGSSATSARVLVPTAMWSSFTLWTPDAPLAGFDAEEMSRRAEEVTAESNDADDAGKAQTRRGWWRRGGAGEGGDEFVRALGEWVGLCEVVS